jgi:hypothetical protein
MNTSHQVPADAGPAAAPADGDWIPRMLRELNQQYFEVCPGGPYPGAPQFFAALSRLASQPAEFLTMQRAVLNLAFAHAWAMQHDWADAWWRFLAGETTPGAAASPGTHAGIAPWTTFLYPRPVQIA